MLDKVHRAPGLFTVLRGLIDRARREGHGTGLYLLPGSGSLDLPKPSGETLAGRVACMELTPFTVFKVNTAQLGRNLGVETRTAGGYIDLLVDLFLVRRLQPWHVNAGNRLVKSPKVHVRDCGVAHALLALGDLDVLLSHPVVGASWEGFVIENLLASAPQDIQPHFYRTSGGAEIDLLLVWPDGRRWAIEIKRGLSPKPDRGFHSACDDLQPERKWIVYPGAERYPIASGIEVTPLADLARELVDLKSHQATSGAGRAASRPDVPPSRSRPGGRRGCPAGRDGPRPPPARPRYLPSARSTSSRSRRAVAGACPA